VVVLVLILHSGNQRRRLRLSNSRSFLLCSCPDIPHKLSFPGRAFESRLFGWSVVSHQLVARFDEKAEISRIDGGNDPPEADGGETNKAARQLMPLGVGKRLQELGVIWSGPTIVLRVMGEVDV
jgi:hypothetical protein